MALINQKYYSASYSHVYKIRNKEQYLIWYIVSTAMPSHPLAVTTSGYYCAVECPNLTYSIRNNKQSSKEGRGVGRHL